MKKLKLVLPILGILVGAVGAFASQSFATSIPGDVNAYVCWPTQECGQVVKICSTTGIIICEALGSSTQLCGRSLTGCDVIIYEKD